MANTKTEAKSMIVSADTLPKSKRGRKPVNVEGLAEVLAQVTPGNAALLGPIFGNVPTAERSKISQQIRNHWDRVHSDGECSIQWLESGEPAVKFKASSK